MNKIHYKVYLALLIFITCVFLISKEQFTFIIIYPKNIPSECYKSYNKSHGQMAVYKCQNVIRLRVVPNSLLTFPGITGGSKQHFLRSFLLRKLEGCQNTASSPAPDDC